MMAQTGGSRKSTSNEKRLSMSESKTVFGCIAQVQAALAKEGISKTRKNAQQGYSFRGIDDVYNALSSLLAEVGLVIIPSYPQRELVERESKSGQALFYVTVRGEYALISAHDGSTVQAGPFWGEAMDSADKATNKAMSAAYKYMAMQVFAIPTEGEDNDADAKTIEPGRITARGGARERIDNEMQQNVDRLASRVLDAFSIGDEQLAFATYLDARGLLRTAGADAQAAFWDKFDSKQRTVLSQMLEAERAKRNAEMAGSQA